VVESEEALSIGLIDRVTSADSLLADARQWAAELSIGSPAAIALTKAILDKSFESSEDQIMALGREAQAICYSTAEHRASVEEFLNKSKK
jgi:enoyl-CoA hydratase/carnithine racemase